MALLPDTKEKAVTARESDGSLIFLKPDTHSLQICQTLAEGLVKVLVQQHNFATIDWRVLLKELLKAIARRC